MNPFARQKWVNRQLDPVKDRLNELDQLQAKNASDIKDVDQQAQNGIRAAQTTADQANEVASAANTTSELNNHHRQRALLQTPETSCRLDHSIGGRRACLRDARSVTGVRPRPAIDAEHHGRGAGSAHCHPGASPREFSVFPSLILLLTLMRLSLDLAATRRILLHGGEGASAAGKVIEAFGQFVVGGNYIVGLVIFIALVAIQFLVVSHGSVRTAEVTARFTLDAMPGKQMAIDSDLNTGLINADQARARREMVAREAEFCGSMDGAARFSQRDSLATILITVINIVAGFLIGVFQLGVPFETALKTYTILTVGNGLVAIIPSLLISVAGGIVVTRAASENSLGTDIGKQIFRTSRALWIVAGCLLALAMIPGMPKIAFLGVGGLAIFAARKMKPAATAEVASLALKAAEKGAKGAIPAIDPMDAVLKLDELMLEVGFGLVPLVDAKQGGQLLARIKSLRKSLAQSLGFLVPSVHITDNLALKEREYVIYLRGVEISRWELRRDICWQ